MLLSGQFEAVYAMLVRIVPGGAPVVIAAAALVVFLLCMCTLWLCVTMRRRRRRQRLLGVRGGRGHVHRAAVGPSEAVTYLSLIHI